MSSDAKDELRSEYEAKDLGPGTRGKYLKDFSAGANVIRLDPDVYAVFKDAASVNKALRELIDLARKSTGGK